MTRSEFKPSDIGLLTLIAFALVMLASGCGIEREVEHYPGMQLVLTQERHPHGFGKSNCFTCHVVENIHLDDHSLGFSLAPSARRAVAEEGLQSCSGCHGTNGVPQP